MTERPIPDYLQLTAEEEQQIKMIRAMREMVRVAQSNQPPMANRPLPAYMEDAVILTEMEVWSRCGKLAEAKRALIDGVDLSAKDEKGMTALHYAILGGDIRVVNLLLKVGANIDEKSDDGESPLELAARLKENALVRLMKKKLVLIDRFRDSIANVKIRIRNPCGGGACAAPDCKPNYSLNRTQSVYTTCGATLSACTIQKLSASLETGRTSMR